MSPIDLERIRSWLAAKFIERQEHHRIRRVYTADGGNRRLKNVYLRQYLSSYYTTTR